MSVRQGHSSLPVWVGDQRGRTMCHDRASHLHTARSPPRRPLCPRPADVPGRVRPHRRRLPIDRRARLPGGQDPGQGHLRLRREGVVQARLRAKGRAVRVVDAAQLRRQSTLQRHRLRRGRARLPREHVL